MKGVLILLLLLVNSGCKDANMVYVCDSRGAARYHYKEKCRGLSNCTYRVVKITEGEAKAQGKTLCHWEN